MSKICMKKYVNMKYLIEISHFICSKLSKNFFKMLTVTHIKCRKEGLTFLGTCPLRSSLLKKKSTLNLIEMLPPASIPSLVRLGPNVLLLLLHR